MNARLYFIMATSFVLVASAARDAAEYQNILLDRPQLVTQWVLLWVVVMSTLGHLVGRVRCQQWAGSTLAVLLGPLGLLISCLLPDRRRRCPDCGEVISPAALRCPHCRKEF